MTGLVYCQVKRWMMCWDLANCQILLGVKSSINAENQLLTVCVGCGMVEKVSVFKGVDV